MSDNVTLNGKKLTEAEFEEKKKNLEREKGTKIVEVKPGEFKTRFQG